MKELEVLKIARNALIAYHKGQDNSYSLSDEDYKEDCKEVLKYFALRDEDFVNLPIMLLFDEFDCGLNDLQVFYEVEILIDEENKKVSLLKRKKGADSLDTLKEYIGAIDEETLDVFNLEIFR